MAYEQYTKCVPAASHSQVNQYVQAAAAAIVAAAGFSILVLLLPQLTTIMPTWLADLLQLGSDPICILLAALVGAIFGVIAYCDWWLGDRLVCLGAGGAPADRMAVGMLVSVEPPFAKTGLDKYDTDFSFNLLPAPNLPGADQAAVGASQPYGELVVEHPDTKQVGLPWQGDNATDWHTGVTSAILHCEFEGGGIVHLRSWAQVAFAIMIAAFLFRLTPWGKAIAAFLAILAFLALMLGLELGPTKTVTPPTADPTLGEFTTNNSNGVGADILAVLGRWVYDAGHSDKNDGWNELHPVKLCVKVSKWRGVWPTNLGPFLANAEKHLSNAIAATTVAAQQSPEHQWRLHPHLDGCRPGGEPPVIA